MRAVWLVVGAALFVRSMAAPAHAQPSAVAQRPVTVVPSIESALPGEPAKVIPVAPAPGAPTRTLWDIFKILPILFYTPETSVGFGAGMLFQFRMPGADAERRPSSVKLGGVYTLENQTVAQINPDLRFGDDDYVLKLDLVGAKYPNRFYGISNKPDREVYDKYTDCYMRGELDFRVRPFSRESWLGSIYVGAHYSAAWSDIREVKPRKASQESTFAAVEDPGEDPVFASGIGPSIAWDSRDGLNWPRSGSFVELTGTAYEPWLGSTVRYRRLHIDARHYQPLWYSHILAMRLVAQSVWGEVPFQRLPQLGGASLFRGWFAGQLRGRRLVAVELEYRIPIRERWAVVAFGSAGRVGEHVRSMSLKGFHVAGGAGLRFSLDKRDRMNIRLDLAYGDSFQPYLQFREAF